MIRVGIGGWNFPEWRATFYRTRSAESFILGPRASLPALSCSVEEEKSGQGCSRSGHMVPGFYGAGGLSFVRRFCRFSWIHS